MTLNKQLWIAVLAIIALNSVVSFLVLFFSTQQNTEEQLYLKNNDDANSLALVLTQAEKSPAEIRLMLSAKFDSGHYARIRLEDNEGGIIDEIYYEGEPSTAPAWFQELAALDVAPGISQVSDGWDLYGTLYVESQTAFAMDTLWSKFKSFIISILILMVVIGAIGSLLLRFILKPLGNIVNQANSFSERKFIKIARPWTADFARVVNAMNSLADRFKANLVENNRRLELARERDQHDPVTKLANINAFFSMLESQLRYRDKDGQNGLLMHSLMKHQGDVQSVAPDVFNHFIRIFAEKLEAFYRQHDELYTDFRIARINETDICVLLSECCALEDIAVVFTEDNPIADLPEFSDAELHCVTAGVYIDPAEASYELLDRVDELLEEVQEQDIVFGFNLQPVPDTNYQCETREQWNKDFAKASKHCRLNTVKVNSHNGSVLHHQTLLTFEEDGEQRGFGRLVEAARRFGTVDKVDSLAVEKALEWLTEHPDKRCSVLLYEESITGEKSLSQLESILKNSASVLSRLSLELREHTAASHPKPFRRFCRMADKYQIDTGLKRVGESFSKVADVHEFGLKYLKIDSTYVYDVVNNRSNQVYLNGLADLAHSLGMAVIADGVVSQKDEEVLLAIGFDGITRLGNKQ